MESYFPKEDDLYQISFNLWCMYHFKTETYDRTLPHVISPLTGDALVRPDFVSKSNVYARAIAYDIHTEKCANEIPDNVWQEAKMDVARLSYEKLEHIIEGKR